MAFIIKGKLTGPQSLFGAFDKLRRSLQTRILRKAVTVAARIVRDVAKAAVPQQTGLYRKSLGVKVKTYKASSVVVGIIGARSGFKREVSVPPRSGHAGYQQVRNPLYYAHLVEFGARPHAIGAGSKLSKQTKKGTRAAIQSGGQHPGFTGSKPLSRAWSSAAPAAAQALSDIIAREVARLS